MEWNAELENMTDINEVLDVLENNTWNLEKTFYFFTHPGALNMTFPCTTILGGSTPGMPCLFPIIYKNKTEHFCFKMDTSKEGCFTRVIKGALENDLHPNNGQHWGYCGHNCKGEIPHPNSPYNLAKYEHKFLWKEFFFVSHFNNKIFRQISH